MTQPKRCPVQLEKGQCVRPLTENRRGHSGGCLVWDDAPERCATEGDDTPASEPVIDVDAALARRKAEWVRRRLSCGCGVNQYCDTCVPPMTRREILESRLSTAKRNLTELDDTPASEPTVCTCYKRLGKSCDYGGTNTQFHTVEEAQKASEPKCCELPATIHLCPEHRTWTEHSGCPDLYHEHGEGETVEYARVRKNDD